MTVGIPWVLYNYHYNVYTIECYNCRLARYLNASVSHRVRSQLSTSVVIAVFYYDVYSTILAYRCVSSLVRLRRVLCGL